jgi:prevent-host-death family protein
MYKMYGTYAMHNPIHDAETGSAMSSLTTYTATEARTKFADIFNEALYGKPVVIDKQGRRVAVVPLTVLERLAELEAWVDSSHAQEALEEFREMGGRTMDEIEKELDLD